MWLGTLAIYSPPAHEAPDKMDRVVDPGVTPDIANSVKGFNQANGLCVRALPEASLRVGCAKKMIASRGIFMETKPMDSWRIARSSGVDG